MTKINNIISDKFEPLSKILINTSEIFFGVYPILLKGGYTSTFTQYLWALLRWKMDNWILGPPPPKKTETQNGHAFQNGTILKITKLNE